MDARPLEANTGQDRVELRELVEAYARNADRKRPEAMADLFTGDGRLLTYEGDPDLVAPAYERHGRDDLARAFQRLAAFGPTTHLLGQQSLALDGDRATGETYCLAHHVQEEGGTRSLMVMAIRYLDEYARVEGEWRIAVRKLAVDWREVRPL